MARLERIAQIETPDSAPRYELRVRRHGPADAEFEIWQMPAVATPRVTSALRVAGLRGRNLELVEHRVLKRLSQSGIKLGRGIDDRKRGYTLNEDLALTSPVMKSLSDQSVSGATMMTSIAGLPSMFATMAIARAASN